MISDFNRREFLSRAGGAVSAMWLSAHWPALLSAAEHARQAANSAAPPGFQFFTPEQAIEIDAIAARIIPSDETPGAREAGVVYFIDRALTTFAVDAQKTYREGLPSLQARASELFPELKNFSSGTPEQQDQILRSFDDQVTGGRTSRRRVASSTFFATIRVHTITGFLIDPDSAGNRNGVGWKVIGRELDHMFQPPFGYYDKDYPGWQPPPDAEKSKV